MKTAKGEVRSLLKVIGELQDLIGQARMDYWNDRNPCRAELVVGALTKAFNLCLNTRNKYEPIDRSKGKRMTIKKGTKIGGFKISDRQFKEFLSIASYGASDGSHHKDWVIQELVKLACDWDEGDLLKWLDQIGWERGIAP